MKMLNPSAAPFETSTHHTTTSPSLHPTIIYHISPIPSPQPQPLHIISHYTPTRFISTTTPQSNTVIPQILVPLQTYTQLRSNHAQTTAKLHGNANITRYNNTKPSVINNGQHRRYSQDEKKKNNNSFAWLPNSLSDEEITEKKKNNYKLQIKLKRSFGKRRAFRLLPFEFEDSNLETDKRTTVMIKNIPNRLSREMLIMLLDQHCAQQNHEFPSLASEYDFIYLPMDFKNHCNLGYAFVNFTRPVGAWRLYNSLHSCSWNAFGSKKIAHISYAKIQGKKALVEHFSRSCFCCITDEYMPALVMPPRNGSSPCSTITPVGTWKTKT